MDQRVVFKFKRGDDEHAIESWRNYGLVCPSLWTTNGNAHLVARLLRDGEDAGIYTLPDGWAGLSVEDMRARLLDFYRRHSERDRP